jgi:HEAT repeat protein
MELRPLSRTGLREPANVAELVRWLRSKKADERILGLAAAWRTAPPEALSPLSEMAERDGALAGPAVQVLARYPGAVGERALIGAAASRQGAARLSAVAALAARTGGPGSGVETTLLRRLRGDRDWRVRAAAAGALRLSSQGSYGPPVRTELERLALDRRQHYPVRIECAAALARAGDERGWDLLREAAAGRGEDGAVLALELCAEVGGAPAGPMLAAALESGREEIWLAAVHGLRRLPRLEAMEVLAFRVAAGGELGHRAALALAVHEGRRALPELLAALRDGSPPVRAAACRTLAAVAGPDAAAALEGKLRQAGERQGVRVAAALSLALVAGPAEVLALRGLIETEPDAVVRAAARDALRVGEARLAAGAGAVSEAGAERMAFARWELLGFVGAGPAGCRLLDESKTERTFRLGDEVALGYRLVRLLGAGDGSLPVEAVMAGPAALRSDLLRAVLVKGDRAVVLVRSAVTTGF